MTKPVVTRFAPSPTGYLHIGGARTALFNWLYARHTGGKFLLRIEDTDRERSTEPAIAAILDGLKWLELDWDGEPIYQFQRADRHREVALQLLAEGKAYHCYASPQELEEMRETGARRRQVPPLQRPVARSRSEGCPARRQAGGPPQGAARRRDRHRGCRAGPRRLAERRPRRHDHPAQRRQPGLQPRRGGGRPRHGHHARDPRRRPSDQCGADKCRSTRPWAGRCRCSRTSR